jgi:hypothetical protein
MMSFEKMLDKFNDPAQDAKPFKQSSQFVDNLTRVTHQLTGAIAEPALTLTMLSVVV